MLTEIAYHDGTWGQPGNMTVSLQDRGFLFGEGVYDVALAYNHRFWDLEPHLDRLEHSLAEMEITMPCSRQELKDLLQQAISQLGGDTQLAYVQVTRGGDFPRSHDYEDCRDSSSLTLIVRDFNDDRHYMDEGRAAILLPDNRWGRCDIKSTSLISNTMAASKAKRAGVFAAIFHRDGLVTEAHAQSVFIVKKGVLITRPLSPAILPSVTRAHLVEFAPQWGIPLEEREYTVEELLDADEVLLMAATKHPMPIVRVDGQCIGQGRVGPMAQKIYQNYEAEMAKVCGPRPLR